jgi:putative ABC transport system ATP-binding protein
MELAGGWTYRQALQRALELLDRVGIAEHAHKLPAALSGGQQQRAAIARALANDPAILFADEPTGSLDSHTAGVVLDLFTDLVEQGRTIFLVTHDQEIARRATRLMTLADGEITSIEEHVMGVQLGVEKEEGCNAARTPVQSLQ